MKNRDVVIIGAGPAGITAAIQLKRSAIDPLLLEKERAGGLLLNANRVENYPGFPDGISGVDLVGLMVWHMNRFGVSPVNTEVKSLRRDGQVFRLETDEEILCARYVVLASGTEGIVPDDLPLDDALFGRRIFRELKDISPQPGHRVAIIGGGDCAFDYALNLAERDCRVSILHRGDHPRALPLLLERERMEPRIEYLPGVGLKGMEEGTNGLVIHLIGASIEHVEVEYLLLAVGRKPRLGFVSPGIASDIETGKAIEGLYLVGDVRRGYMRQVGIAVGDGLIAAMDIGSRLNRR